jgi:hypothetical protein
MSSYSFQPRFVEPIRAGTKRQTIRAARKNQVQHVGRHGGHARVGEELQLYCRQRHPGGFLIMRARCVGVEAIDLIFTGDDGCGTVRTGNQLIIGGDLPGPDTFLDGFARGDGFQSWDEMRQFWFETHGVDRFSGWLIRWEPICP